MRAQNSANVPTQLHARSDVVQLRPRLVEVGPPKDILALLRVIEHDTQHSDVTGVVMVVKRRDGSSEVCCAGSLSRQENSMGAVAELALASHKILSAETEN